MDGSSVQTGDTEPNQAEFPQQGQQKKGAGYPQARLVAVISLATAAVLGVGMAAYKGKGTGEHAIFSELLGCFSKGDVMVADAYYASYFLIAALKAKGGLRLRSGTECGALSSAVERNSGIGITS